MEAPAVITLDFETHPIARRPKYPPAPVGIAIKWPGESSRYWACGHTTGNNCTPGEAMEALGRAWHHPLPKLFFNAKFDVAVAVEQLGLPMLPWSQIEDAMFLAFLADPHARNLGLKNLANDLLNWPPDERDAVADWVVAHKAQLCQAYPWNRKTNKKTGKPVDNITPSEAGAWIFATPGEIVGPYACGDTDRTEAMFEHLWPLIQDNGMGSSYDRKRRVMPIFLANERIGIRTDMGGLERDIERLGAAFTKSEEWLRRELRASGLNFDADADVASVLLDRGIVPPENWQETASGGLSTSKENLLPEHFTGPQGAEIASTLGYRNRLKTCLTMFMGPWLDQASQNGGYITTNWNQVRGNDQSGGTRTGRPSTYDHNLLNVSKSWMGRDDGYVHPTWLSVPELPLCRMYLLPDEDQEFLHRDFSGQELRIFAHFEQGALWDGYQADPSLDPHKMIGEELMRVAGREIERTKVKTLNFQGIYGGGVPALQRKLRVPLFEAKELKMFHDRALPGRKILNEEIKRVILRGDPVRTWGGRLYFAEEPGFSKKHGRHMTYEYKLINYIVQGSAADLTEESIIAWDEARERDARFLITVYDEINISAARDRMARQMALLKEAMEARRLTVPMLSDPKHGASWGLSKRCPPEKGCPLCQ